MLTVGSLFSGIGGLDLGLERAGMKVLWQVEVDEFCRTVLAKHWPDVPRYGDVRECSAHNLEPVDLICGGFPCVEISSVSVRRTGLAGEQSGLWAEFARIVRALRPRYVLVENSPSVLVRGMGQILSDLAAIGYDAEWEGLPAAALSAPHLRARQWILAYPTCNGDRFSTPTIFAGRDIPINGAWRGSEPAVRTVDDGLSSTVDRLRALGNAVVPQVVEWVGRRILAAHEHTS